MSRIIILTVWLLVMFETAIALWRVARRAFEMIRLSMAGLLDTDGDGEIEFHEVKNILYTVFCCVEDADGDGDPSNDGLRFLMSDEASQEWFHNFQATAPRYYCCHHSYS